MEAMYADVKHERETHFQYRDYYLNQDEKYWESYFDLIHNLDGESVETVNHILNRMKLVMSSTDEKLDFFLRKEKEAIKKLDEEFYPSIFHISENLYAYKNFLLPKKYFDAIVFYYKYGLDLFSSIDKIKQGNVIDGGAYIGDSSIVFARLTEGRVFAFEALEDNRALIQKTIALNHVSNINIVGAALGRKSGYALLEENDNPNWSTMIPYESRDYIQQKKVEVRSIDDYVNENNIEVSLIKLHIEGMEYDAILGAENTLLNQRPALLIHIHHTPTDFWKIKPFIEKLNVGYSFRIWKPANGKMFTGTILLAEVV